MDIRFFSSKLVDASGRNFLGDVSGFHQHPLQHDRAKALRTQVNRDVDTSQGTSPFHHLAQPPVPTVCRPSISWLEPPIFKCQAPNQIFWKSKAPRCCSGPKRGRSGFFSLPSPKCSPQSDNSWACPIALRRPHSARTRHMSLTLVLRVQMHLTLRLLMVVRPPGRQILTT